MASLGHNELNIVCTEYSNAYVRKFNKIHEKTTNQLAKQKMPQAN